MLSRPLQIVALLAASAAISADDTDGIAFFEARIRPILVDHCYRCHSADSARLKGGLRLDTRAGLLAGGDTGPAIVPGDVERSLLVTAVRYHDEDLLMPPKTPLAAAAVDDLVAWVAMGAPDPRVDGAPTSTEAEAVRIAAAAAEHWAFQRPVANDPPAPPASLASWVRTPIDAFVAEGLAAAGLTPAPAVDRRTLLRRATVDLTGLPPTADEVAAFVADASPDAFARAVDRLLASPRYGERWGRHWLDVARYADTKGYVFDGDRNYPFAYTYRDWVIDAFNRDLPYDRFLIEQIAADRLELGDDRRPLAALGFLTLGRRFLEQRPDIIDDRIDVVTRGTLGLTVSCARCHDHKFDPIPTADYYSLYGVFDAAREPGELPLLGGAVDPTAKAEFDAALGAARQALDGFVAKRHGEVIAVLRSADKIAAYLLAAQDAMSVDDDAARALADRLDLRQVPLLRWRERLRGGGPVFAAWTAYAGLPTDRFADAVGAVPPAPEWNGIVRVAFADAPTSLRQVAERYANIIAAHAGDAVEVDPDAEALRQVLRGDGAPTAIPTDLAGDAFDGEDHRQVRDLRKKVDEVVSTHRGSPPRAMALEDVAEPPPARVFIRGDPGNHGAEVPRRFLAILAGTERAPFVDGSGRLELARAIASADNPLTARVLVNRVWAQHFGVGLVATPSDFGLRGDPPSHRALLDWLALRFIADGWSVKSLHRLIMGSAAYQQASDHAALVAAMQLDPDNRLLWRANRRRLDFEALRDGLLVAAGALDPTMGGRAVDLTQPGATRRTVYGFVDRQNLANLFRTFDFASPDAHSPRRHLTSVPQQALYLMNSPFAVEQARRLARRSEDAGEDAATRVSRLHALVHARPASADEVAIGIGYVADCARSPAGATPPAPSPWSYGFGRYDVASGQVAFTAFAVFAEDRWQPESTMPHEQLGYLALGRDGGHVGRDRDHAVIRRWTAPRDATVAISGTITRPETQGDGVDACVVVAGAGVVGSWTLPTGESATAVERIVVRRREAIDFIVDGRDNDGWDSFQWAPVITAIDDDADGQWQAAGGFAGPPTPAPALTPWEKYAQALLMSNEFAFID